MLGLRLWLRLRVRISLCLSPRIRSMRRLKA